MKRTTKLLAATALLTCALSGAVLAGDKERCRHLGPPGAPFDRGFERLLNDLDLSEQQLDRIKEIRGARHEKLADGWQEHREFRERLMEAVHNNASERELRKLLEQQSSAHIDKMVEMLKTHQQILAVLTDEQRATLEEKRQHMLEKMEKGPLLHRDL